MNARPDKPFDWHKYSIGLEASLLERDKRIAELEKIISEFSICINQMIDRGESSLLLKSSKEVNSLITAHNLEQQAKGLQDWVGSEKDIQFTPPVISIADAFKKGVHLTMIDADKKARQLRNQAKGENNES